MIIGAVVVIAILVIIGVFFVVIGLRPKGEPEPVADTVDKVARQEADHVFNEEFREELRNRGRLHFEKIINENAMFLQQDLRLTTSQLNEYMKTEINNKLQEEFGKYEQSINDAKELATTSIQKTNTIIDEQRKALGAQLSKQLETEKASLITRFQEDMADIINHYVLAAIGNQIDLTDQLEYIMGELEANKAAITEDILNGA